MAGGMGGGWEKRGHGVPLADRVRAGNPRSRSDRSGQSDRMSLAESACPGRHCWVSEAVDGLGEKRPGLLVEWRRSAGRETVEWEGRVIYLSLSRPDEGGWVLVEEWLPARRLAPF